MGKFLHFLYNLGLILGYLAGVMVIEAFCAAKLIFDPGWTIRDDMITILTTSLAVGIHYFLLYQMLKSNMLSKASVYILSVIDIVIFCAVALFLIFPNNVIGEAIISTHIFIMIIQCFVLSARIFNCYFIEKMNRK